MIAMDGADGALELGGHRIENPKFFPVIGKILGSFELTGAWKGLGGP